MPVISSSEDTTLWSRAAVSLLEQKDFPLALQAAEHALGLDGKNAEAARVREAAKAGMKRVAPKAE